MNAILSSRTRAGMLLAALALVGGTGCITMSVVNHVQDQNRQRARDEARQRDIAQLTPRAQGGDAHAALQLVDLLVSGGRPGDAQRAAALLEQAAATGYAPAQAALGMALVSGKFWAVMAAPPFPGPIDGPRGVALLQRAATATCKVKLPSRFYPVDVDPADKVADYFARTGEPAQAQLWRARDVLHCQAPQVSTLAWRARRGAAAQQGAAEAFALLLLTDSHEDIDAVRMDIAPDLVPGTVTAGERLATDLRVRVAQSEQHYPRPSRKEMP
jgi:hypothetical protein